MTNARSAFYIRETTNPWEAAQGRRESLFEVWRETGGFADEHVTDHLTEADALADIAQREVSA